MKRRTAIKNSALFMGGILSATTVASFLEGCVAPVEGEVWKPENLSVEQGKIIGRINHNALHGTDILKILHPHS